MLGGIRKRIGDYEFMTCDEHLLRGSKDYAKAEIVKWQGETCYVVCFFERTTEGFEMIASDKITEHLYEQNFINLVCYGFGVLKVEYNFTQLD